MRSASITTIAKGRTRFRPFSCKVVASLLWLLRFYGISLKSDSLVAWTLRVRDCWTRHPLHAEAEVENLDFQHDFSCGNQQPTGF